MINLKEFGKKKKKHEIIRLSLRYVLIYNRKYIKKYLCFIMYGFIGQEIGNEVSVLIGG